MIENVLPEGQTHLHRIVPSGLPELTFYLADLPESLDKTRSIPEKFVLTGQIKNYYDLKIKGKLAVFSVYFYPDSLPVFFDIPASEAQNQIIPLKYITGQSSDELEDKLLAKRSFGERIQAVEDFLSKQMLKVAVRHHHQRINHCINLINHSGGKVSIKKLTDQAFLSRKQFERTFRNFVGTTPGQFIKTVRFQHAIKTKSLGKALSLTEVAYDSGYYDQSHMVNDFKSISGKTPKEYFKEAAPYSDYFQ